MGLEGQTQAITLVSTERTVASLCSGLRVRHQGERRADASLTFKEIADILAKV